MASELEMLMVTNYWEHQSLLSTVVDQLNLSVSVVAVV